MKIMLKKRMATIEQLFQQWQRLQPLRAEDRKRLEDKFRLEFNYNSNHIEGNTLTYGQTKLLLFFGDTTGDAKMRDYEEMKAHNAGLRWIEQIAADHSRRLTEREIRELNQIILVEDFWKVNPKNGSRYEIKVGTYKTRPNSVITATGEEFHYASPQETPAMMHALVEWLEEEMGKGELSRIELASLLHYRYIRIHPFEDGNGRIARLLVTYVLEYFGYPMIIIPSEDKERYLRVLNQSDINVGLSPSDGANARLEDIEPFVEYMKERLEWSLETGIKAAKGESIEERGDISKKIAVFKRNLSDKNIEKSSQSVSLAIYDTFFPVVGKIAEQLRDMIDMFDSFNYIIYGPSSIPKRSFKAEEFEKMQRETMYSKIDYFNLRNMIIEFVFKGFRYDGENTFNERFDIGIDFNANEYEINSTFSDFFENKVVRLNRSYNEQLSDEDAEEFVSKVCSAFLARVESMIDKKIFKRIL